MPLSDYEIVQRVDYVRHASLVNGRLMALKEVTDLALKYPLNPDFMLALTGVLSKAIDDNDQISAYARIILDE